MKKIINPRNIRIFLMFFLCFNIFMSCIGQNLVFADSADDMWKKASQWFGNVETNNNSAISIEIVDEFVTAINLIGTVVIVLATIVLGIKYILGSVESKADAKESMITLLVACIFFFGWTGISNILVPGGRLIFTDAGDTKYSNFVNRLFNYFVFAANIASILAIIYVGVRYIFSGASGKADLKSRSPYFVIGIILAFATVSFLNFLSESINQIIAD